MAKKESKKTVKRGLVVKGLLVILSLIILIFIMSYAWFTSNPGASAQGVSVKTEANTDFEVAIGYKSSDSNNIYRTTAFTNGTGLNLDDLTPVPLSQDEVVTGGQSAFKDFQALDVTSNGNPTGFYRPALKENNSKVIEEPASYKTITAGKEYLWYDLIIKSKESINVILSPSSYARGVDEQYAGDYAHLVGSNVSRKSEYSAQSGNNAFSEDCIVGSLRFSFVPMTFDNNSTITDVTADPDGTDVNISYVNNSANCIWLPRPDLKINPTIVNNKEVIDGHWTMLTGQTYGETYQHWYYEYTSGTPNTFTKTQYGAAGTATAGKLIYGSYTGAQSTAYSVHNNQNNYLVTCNKQIGDYYYGKTRVYLWIEGADTEARKALVSGQFEIGCILKMTN